MQENSIVLFFIFSSMDITRACNLIIHYQEHASPIHRITSPRPWGTFAVLHR